MIHSARPIITPVTNIVFCFVVLELKSGDGRTTCAKRIIPTGRYFGLAEWINTSPANLVIHQAHVAFAGDLCLCFPDEQT